MTISKFIDQKDSTNQVIISTLDSFLISKDSSLFQNRFWLESDFDKYKFPFLDLYRIEFENNNPEVYNANLLEIIELENPNDFLVKIAFVGRDSSGMSVLKSIYNLIANVESDKVIFSRSLNHFVSKWKKVERYPMTYFISPNKELNEKEVADQLDDIERLNSYFDTDSIEMTYYSCTSPIELFQLKGFDYLPGMYFSKKGGIVEFGNHVFSGNSSEYYTHEIVHIYVNTLFPGANSLLNEGIAMYFGGSGGETYEWHRKALLMYVKNKPNFNFLEYMNAFDKKYVNETTSIPYMTGALIYQFVIDNYGKETFFKMLGSRKAIWESLEIVGLTKENLNKELLAKLKNG
ncbi:MAG: hypothetical protein AAF806_12055 [Bacteroidota bacterium]